jgi:hypothetical protein
MTDRCFKYIILENYEANWLTWAQTHKLKFLDTILKTTILWSLKQSIWLEKLWYRIFFKIIVDYNFKVYAWKFILQWKFPLGIMSQAFPLNIYKRVS